jgi:tetratricopeptide (TPR) repeat protein
VASVNAFYRSVIALALSIVLLWACATPQTKRLMESPPPELPVRVMLQNVPFIAQQASYCGPAALAMTMRFYGLKVSQDSLARAVYVPELKGSLQAEMLAATRRHGLLAYELTPSLRKLLEEISAGHPVVVLQNLGVSWYPVWHYAVAIGYDLDTQELVLHSGTHQDYREPLAAFERTWGRSSDWALVPLPPTMLPRDENPLRVVKAAAALEQTGQMRAAERAYAATARRWPDNLVAHMGVGNTRYALHQIKAAAVAFREAIAVDPRSAAAHNNLAVSLSDVGCHHYALQMARRAVALDDGDPSFEETLDEISAAPAAKTEPARCAELFVADTSQNRTY